MKIYSQPADSPDGVQAWAHEDLLDSRYSSIESKITMDSFNSMLSEISPQPATLTELKNLDPEYLSVSPDTSTSLRQDPTSSTSPNNQYKGAITNNNSFLGCGTPEPVSTTTLHLCSSASAQPIKQESPSFPMTDAIEDIASIIGSAISENPLNNHLNTMISEPMDHALDLEAWIESISEKQNQEQLEHTHLQTLPSIFTSIQCATQVPQTSTTTNAISTSLQGYETIVNHDNSHHQSTNSSPMLKSLLAAGTITSSQNYMEDMSTAIYSTSKHDVPMPILEARLTQDMKDSGRNNLLSGHEIHSSKPNTMFTSRSSYDCVPHSTEQQAYDVTTTGDLLICKYERQSSYLDDNLMASPESTDQKYALEYQTLKNKNRQRPKNPKMTIRNEGSKDKPIHHCNICHRGFLNKSNIKVHLRTHTGEKPFKCETCSKAFRQKAHLLKHYTIHRREQGTKTCVVD